MSVIEKPDNRLSLHPIQLEAIGVRGLFIKVINADNGIENSDVKLAIGHTPLGEDDTLVVTVRAMIGETEDGEPETPCILRVALVATFRVNTVLFPVEHLDHWADFNAMFILYPYLREHIYSLTSRAGIRNAILPLLEVPTLSIPPAEESPSAGASPALDS